MRIQFSRRRPTAASSLLTASTVARPWPLLVVLALTTVTTACGESGGMASEAAATGLPSAASASPSITELPSSMAASASPSVTVGDGDPWIVYQWSDGSGEGIFLVRPDSTGKHQLVADMTGSEIHPDWAPDGSRIAFVRQTSEGSTELWVVDADGSDAERLYACELPCNEIHFPDWSPDGASIFFSQSADVPPGEQIPRTFAIERIDVAERTVETVYSRDDGVEAWQARVSPDGSLIAYAAGSEELGAAIFTSPVEGGSEAQLTEWDLLAAHPDWTPDGRIVFHTHDLAIFPNLDESANLYIMDADGSNLEQLTSFDESGLRAAQSRVAPDGTGVTFTHVDGAGLGVRRLAFLEFGEAEPGWLTADPIDGTHPHLRPGSEDPGQP